MKIKFLMYTFFSLFLVSPLNACASFNDISQSTPSQLNCKFTDGYYTNLYFGDKTESKILWSFSLALDESKGVVFFKSGERQELIKAIYGANRVQFPFEHIGRMKKVLLNLETLGFTMKFRDDIIDSTDVGVCSR